MPGSDRASLFRLDPFDRGVILWFFADNVAFRQVFLKFAMLSGREADILT